MQKFWIEVSCRKFFVALETSWDRQSFVVFLKLLCACMQEMHTKKTTVSFQDISIIISVINLAELPENMDPWQGVFILNPISDERFQAIENWTTAFNNVVIFWAAYTSALTMLQEKKIQKASCQVLAVSSARWAILAFLLLLHLNGYSDKCKFHVRTSLWEFYLCGSFLNSSPGIFNMSNWCTAKWFNLLGRYGLVWRIER